MIDPLNGDTRPAPIFVAALGASNFTYAEGRWSEGLADWISVHVRRAADADQKSRVHAGVRYGNIVRWGISTLATYGKVAIVITIIAR